MKIERFVPARDASTAAQPEEKRGAGGAGLRFRNGLLAAFGLRGQSMPDAQPDSARGWLWLNPRWYCWTKFWRRR